MNRPASEDQSSANGRAGVEFASAPAEESSPGAGRRTRPGAWIPILLSVAVIAAAAVGIGTRGGDSAEASVFRYTMTEGETRTYRMVIGMNFNVEGVPDMPAEPIEATVDTAMTMTAKEVREDGTTVVEVSTSVTNASVAGEPAGTSELPEAGGVTTITIGPDGRVVSVEGTGWPFDAFSSFAGQSPLGQASPVEGSSSQFFFPQFPDRPIAPGDTWTQTSEVPFPFGDGATTVTTDGRHDGFSDTRFGRAAKIHVESRAPMDMSFGFSELLGAFGAGMGAGEMPPELADARVVYSGSTQMEGDSLVVPETSDLVRMDGDMVMDIRFRMENVPAEFGALGGPDDFGMNGTMRMQIERVA